MYNSELRISIIMAVANMADTVQIAIDSFVNQDYANKELIVIEGPSVDNTVEILKKNDGVIDYWESVDEKGIYKAWNTALPHATGDWINFLGADDFFPSNDVLSRIVSYLATSGSSRLVYGQIAMMKPNGEISHMIGSDWKKSKELMYKSMPIPHPGTFHHRKLFDVNGYFDESFKISGDYEFVLRELKHGKAMFVPDVIVRNMMFGGMSTSWKYDIVRLFENARSRKLNSMPAYTKEWSKMFLNHLIKYIVSSIKNQYKHIKNYFHS